MTRTTGVLLCKLFTHGAELQVDPDCLTVIPPPRLTEALVPDSGVLGPG